MSHFIIVIPRPVHQFFQPMKEWYFSIRIMSTNKQCSNAFSIMV